MSNPVFNSVRNIAANTLSDSFKKVVGGILASKGTPNTSSFASLEQPTESNYLAYPANVDTDPMQGHWVMFEILKLNETKVGYEKNDIPNHPVHQQNGAQFQAQENTNHKVKSDVNVSGGRTLFKAMVEASVKLDKTIALYMPPSVSVSYNTQYADKEISTFADFGHDAIKAFAGSAGMGKGVLTRLSDAVGGASDHLGAGIRRGLIKAADSIAPGVESLIAIESGEIIGNHMELMFQGVGRRSFSFTFVFIPKSEREAATVANICYLFKKHMLPKWANTTTKRAMTIPDMFDITYMYGSGDSKHLNKISTCFCESAQVTYGGDRYTAYTDGRPQKTTLALGFKEIEIITRERVEQGF